MCFLLHVFSDCFWSCPSLPILIAFSFILINVFLLREDALSLQHCNSYIHLETISQQNCPAFIRKVCRQFDLLSDILWGKTIQNVFKAVILQLCMGIASVLTDTVLSTLRLKFKKVTYQNGSFQVFSINPSLSINHLAFCGGFWWISNYWRFTKRKSFSPLLSE